MDVWTDGTLAAAAAALGRSYAPRDEQQRYAELVTRAIVRDRAGDGGILLLEGGTGIGKTLGYLIPACLEVAETGGRVLVATYTLALMRQIVGSEAPLAAAVAFRTHGRRLRIAELRGRRNFASPSRCRALAQTMREQGLTGQAGPYLDLAAQAEDAGRRAARLLAEGAMEAEGVSDILHAAMIDVFAAERGIDLAADEISLLVSSEAAEQAPYQLNHVLSRDATILVTTHAMAAIALGLRTLPGAQDGTQGGNGYRVMIIDEAERWAAAAASVMISALSMDSTERAVQKLMAVAREGDCFQAVAAAGIDAIVAIERLRALAPATPGEAADLDAAGIAVLTGIGDALGRMAAAALPDKDRTASAGGLVSEAEREAARALQALRGSNVGFWTGRLLSSRVQGKVSLQVIPAVPGRIMKRIWQPAAGAEPLARSLILTSATLATPGYGRDGRWRSLSIATGIAIGEDSRVHADLLDSIQPQVFGKLHVRFADPLAPVPSPGETGILPADALAYVVDTIAMARQAGGRTFVLVPAYADVEQLAPVAADAILHVRGQPLRQVLARYREDPGACLVTPAAWEGVDLPGMIDQLVIPRLPFPPSDRENGRVDSMTAMLMRLAQGIGRCIRSREDRATVWFADPRMPPPPGLIERSLILPHPASQPHFLQAIPERFRVAFASDPGAADFGVRIPPAQARPFVRRKKK